MASPASPAVHQRHVAPGAPSRVHRRQRIMPAHFGPCRVLFEPRELESPSAHQRRGVPGAPLRRRPSAPYPLPQPRHLEFEPASLPFIPEEVEPDFQVMAQPDDRTIVGDCSVCLTGIEARHAVNTTCSHVFHLECINSWRRVQGHEHAQCPLCRRRLQQIRGLHGVVQFYQQLLADFQHNMEADLRDVIDLSMH